MESAPPSTPQSVRIRFEVLVMSEAGKPIYSYSKRADGVTLMPLCSALMNYAAKTQKETLRSIRTSKNLQVTFTTRSPLVIVVLHEIDSCIDPLVIVDQVEAQIISILTAKTLRSVFDDRPTFDLKRLLYGSEKLIDSTNSLSISRNKLEWPYVEAFLAVTSSSTSIQSKTGSNGTQPAASSNNIPIRPHRVLIPVVAMHPSARDTIHNVVSSSVTSNSKNMVFSLLFKMTKPKLSDNRPHASNIGPEPENETDDGENRKIKLITVCNHHSRHKLKVADIHLILALLEGSRSQLMSVESLWLPVCLPRFNQDAFLHSYLSFVNNKKNCLVMLSVDREEFTNCQKARNTIESKIENLYKDNGMKSKINYQLSPLVDPVLLGLQEKLMKSTLTDEETMQLQQQVQIYNSKLELYHARQLQFLCYQTSKQVLWWQRSEKSFSYSTLYYVTRKMLGSAQKTLWLKLDNETVILGWHVPAFQLYAQFDITITTNEATEVVQRIASWIKKEEDNFSIRDYK